MDTPVDPKTVRIYHVTHVDNLASILGEGAVLADGAGAAPVVDMSAPDARVFRRAAEVDGADAVVADYVPFLLSTDAARLERRAHRHPGSAPLAGRRRAPACRPRHPRELRRRRRGPAHRHRRTVVLTDADARPAAWAPRRSGPTCSG
jgi:hypothetical protein